MTYKLICLNFVNNNLLTKFSNNYFPIDIKLTKVFHYISKIGNGNLLENYLVTLFP